MEQDELMVLIPSETVRNYVLETGWSFTDKQKAAILYRQDCPGSKVREALYTLRDTTGDAVLQRQLTEYLEREEKAFELLRDNRERNYVYVMAYGEEEEEKGYFLDYEMAYRFGADTGLSFVIEKHLIASERVLDQFENGAYYDFPEEIIGFDENGNIDCFESIVLEPADWFSGDEWYERFEHMFYEVPNPFERGDMVRKVGEEKYGIVEDSQKGWQEKIERSRTSEPGVGPDESDVEVRVAFPDEEGIFYHEHINPIFLERYEPASGTKDRMCAARDNLLLMASEMCKGNGALEDWWDCAMQYRLARKAKREREPAD